MADDLNHPFVPWENSAYNSIVHAQRLPAEAFLFAQAPRDARSARTARPIALRCLTLLGRGRDALPCVLLIELCSACSQDAGFLHRRKRSSLRVDDRERARRALARLIDECDLMLGGRS